MAKIEFGISLQDRAESCAETIRNTVKFSFNNESFWQDNKKIFPEYTKEIDGIRQAVKRRRMFIEQEKIHEGENIRQKIAGIAQFQDPIATDILMNRLYPSLLPLSIDEIEKEKILNEVNMMVSESSEELKTKRGIDFLSFVLLSGLRIEPKVGNTVEQTTLDNWLENSLLVTR